MNYPPRRSFLWILFGQLALLVSRNSTVSAAPGTSQTDARHSFHDRPPLAPLPATLDPQMFQDRPVAFVVYTLAQQIEATLYQVPCYCPCDELDGHSSLLDCFTSDHGERCPRCQMEVIFCFEEGKQGKTPAQIRKALKRHKATKIDLTGYVEGFFAREGSVRK